MKKLQYLFTVLSALCFAVPAFAQSGSAPAVSLVPIGAGLAMGLAAGLCGLGQGKAVASAAEGMARNPGAAAAIRGALILGLVLIESLALYTLVITYVAK